MNNMRNNKNLIAADIKSLQNIRQSSNDYSMPTKKDEYWQYSSLQTIKSDYEYASQAQASDFDVEFDGYKIFFENGYFAPKKSKLPEGIEVLPLIEAIILGKTDGLLNNIENNFFVSQNNKNLQEGVYINVAKNIEFKKPVAIINYSNQDNTWSATRNIITIMENSSLDIVEIMASKNNCLANVVNEIYISRGAKLNHYKINKNASNHIANACINVCKDASYIAFYIQRNNVFAREEVVVNLLEQGADANLSAIYEGFDKNILDFTIKVNHKAGNTTSNQLVKGVFEGSSKGVYQGKVSINENCRNVVGNQQHRAIILSDNASVDVKPELEIYNDDVKCSHGSAIGKLDEDSLFYLQTRGVSKEDARALLIKAFLSEVFDKIQNIDIKNLFLLDF